MRYMGSFTRALRSHSTDPSRTAAIFALGVAALGIESAVEVQREDPAGADSRLVADGEAADPYQGVRAKGPPGQSVNYRTRETIAGAC